MIGKLRFEELELEVSDLGGESSLPDLLGEDISQNRLEFNLSEDDEIYEAYGRKRNAYPYRQCNAYTRELHKEKVKTAVLENENLKAVFLIERGGRLWQLYDKKNKKDLLYTNDVLRYSNLAVRNAWFSGGVEWNIGVIGHTPLTNDPLYVSALNDEEGNPILRMYEFERIRKVVYQMDFWLSDTLLNCRMRIANENREVVPMYWWSNMAVPEYEDGHIIVPAKEAYTSENDTVFKVELPIVKGVDITDYKKIKASTDYFFDIPEGEVKYIANVDKEGSGMLHVSTQRLRSRKLFTWGNGRAADYWQKFLTKDAGRYIEIQGGLAKTQYGCIPMAPNTVWEWVEQYGAIQLPEKYLEASHEEKSTYVTSMLKEANVPDNIETLLKQTKKMAKTSAKLVASGKPYGALREMTDLTAHLTFVTKGDNIKQWETFFTSGIVPVRKVEETPDEFLIDENNLTFLVESMNTRPENQKNWYAYYQLGIGYMAAMKDRKARQAFEKSIECEVNPWAYHGLSVCDLREERFQEAAANIMKGWKRREEDLFYLKETLFILQECKEYEDICEVYESIKEEWKEIGRLKLYYTVALYKLGEAQKAFELLEEKGGISLDDAREGDDTISNMWSDLYMSLYGVEKEAPEKYLFKANI
ncbi:DUF5107 domain-containing protein [Lachnospiraceae bacterium OttesenSCG-928-E19]|nr:DUF5107 domain-containing protein [Lachnospiraceae bacterium OttesenSCG-928-E19]